jgi:hypothetical protein
MAAVAGEKSDSASCGDEDSIPHGCLPSSVLAPLEVINATRTYLKIAKHA